VLGHQREKLLTVRGCDQVKHLVDDDVPSASQLTRRSFRAVCPRVCPSGGCSARCGADAIHQNARFLYPERRLDGPILHLGSSARKGMGVRPSPFAPSKASRAIP
jgi:hypothetical protein